MPSKKRTVKYEENTDADGDRNVEVSDEISHEDTGSEEHDTNSLTDQDDERYTPASGN